MQKLSLLVVLVALVSMGCASAGGGASTGTGKFVDLRKLGAPNWTVDEGSSLPQDKGKAFYGVGVAENISNMGLLRTSADNRARNQITKLLENYSASIGKDAMESISVGKNDGKGDEQNVRNAIKNTAFGTISGIEIIDHWQHPDTGAMYSLARLDLNAVKNALDKSKELNNQVKEQVRKNADKLFDELEKAEAKKEAQK